MRAAWAGSGSCVGFKLQRDPPEPGRVQPVPSCQAAAGGGGGRLARERHLSCYSAYLRVRRHRLSTVRGRGIAVCLVTVALNVIWSREKPPGRMFFHSVTWSHPSTPVYTNESFHLGGCTALTIWSPNQLPLTLPCATTLQF